jgi:glutathione-regulated potassium-efflux system ancillary protein KefC
MNYTLTGIALLAATVLLVPLFRFLKLGGVLGYIVAGILIGPYAVGIVKQPDVMAHTAELGVTLLMFLVGLELQPSRLLALRREVFGLGAAQVLGCATAFGLGAWALGVSPQAAWIVGAGISMSSTAFILPMLTDAKATQARYGSEAVAVCIFQDLAVIPLLLVIGLLDTDTGKVPGWSALLAVVCIALFGRRVMGWVFGFAARFGNNEVFTAAALCITLMISSGLEEVGLSASLGAFIAGVLLADSAFKHKLEASIAPFEGLLLGLFFMTVGMGVNLAALWANPWLPLAIGVAIIAGKAVVIYFLRSKLAGMLRQPTCDRETGLRLAFTLAVGGEFAFVLFQAALSGGYLSAATVDLLTLAVVCSMVLAPLAILVLNKWLDRRNRSVTRAFDTIEETEPVVIIAGFGRVGQIVGRILNVHKIKFTALDVSVEHVDFLRRFGNKIHYGDASELSLLESARMSHAKLFVLAVDNVETSLSIAKLVQHHYPLVRIVARARDRNHWLQLRALGIETVVRETWLGSVELGKQTLVALDFQGEDLDAFLKRFVLHDEALLDKQQATAGSDLDTRIKAMFKARAELEHILEGDAVNASDAPHAL